MAQRLELRPGEVAELLERLPVGTAGAASAAGERGDAGAALRKWEWRLARSAVEAYAARKRAVARLARQEKLAKPPPAS
jgi:hypothetical protein